jgi:purine-binding chemotaxis protein CheW
VKDSSRTTQNLNWGSKTVNENRAQKLSRTQELLADDVTREVVRAREMLGNAFQTLIFDVGKLPLAVPLVKLGGIHAYSEEDITPIFGTPNWFKGLIPSEQGNIMLVDTAKYIMPEKYEQVKDQLQYKYAILLDDTRWALACTHVREAKTLTIDDIRWAQKGSRKEWFAGMVVQFMCALLEVDSLINALYRAGKKQK